VALLYASSSVDAATIEVSRGDDGNTLVSVSGDIELDDIAQFWSKVARLPSATIAFRSDGGSLLAGIRIGTLIRDNGFVTLVPDGARCASACAIAWLGGAQRLIGIDSRVGFHAAYVLKGHRTTESGPGNAVLGAYLFQLGLSEDAIVYITQADPSSMKWLSLDQAAQHGIDVSLASREIGAATLTGPVVSQAPQGDLEQRAIRFVLALAARWSSPNEDALRAVDALYASTVRYHGKPTARQDVVLDKEHFAERWPERTYTVQPDSISATCVKETEVCTVRGTLNRLLVNVATKATSRDVMTFDYHVAGSGEGPYIVEETSAITAGAPSLAKSQGHLQAWNPIAAVGRTVRRLFAQVSHSSTRQVH
jgi:hypothetical protein